MTARPVPDELASTIHGGRAVVLAGAGVAMQASGEPRAMWSGLLKHGIGAAVTSRTLSSEEAERLNELVSRGDTEDFIEVGGAIGRALEAPIGELYRRWLDDAVGSLRAVHPEIIRAIASLNLPIATTNYDGLFEEVTGLPHVTWVRFGVIQQIMTGRRTGILHLHGHFRDPASVVLGRPTYEDIGKDGYAQSIQLELALANSLVMVGFGNGLGDYNLGPLLREIGVKADGRRHYVLARESDAEKVRREVDDFPAIRVVVYGDEYSDLVGFLSSIPACDSSPRVQAHSRSRPFLTLDDWAALASELSPLGYDRMLVGRQSQLAELSASVNEAPSVTFLSGAGGLGKTHLALELARTLEPSHLVRFVRPDLSTADEHSRVLSAELKLLLDDRRPVVLIVDDAHELVAFPTLVDILIANFQGGRPVSLVLVTRSQFVASLSALIPRELKLLRSDSLDDESLALVADSSRSAHEKDIDDPPPESEVTVQRYSIELDQLDPGSMSVIIGNFEDDDTCGSAVEEAQGIPLIALLRADMIRGNPSVRGLPASEVINRYVEGLISDVGKTAHPEACMRLLAVVAVLKSLNLNDDSVLERLERATEASASQLIEAAYHLLETRLIALVDRDDRLAIRVSSGVIADHIVARHFFREGDDRDSFESRIVDNLFEYAPVAILTSLSKAEVVGKSHIAAELFDPVLERLWEYLSIAGNRSRHDLIVSLPELAQFRPDAVLTLVERVMKAEPAPPESRFTFTDQDDGATHRRVLEALIPALAATGRSGDLRRTTGLLRNLLELNVVAERQDHLRQRARAAIIELATFRHARPLERRLELCDVISEWIDDEPDELADLVTDMLDEMAILKPYELGMTPDLNAYHVGFRRLQPIDSVAAVRSRARELAERGFARSVTRRAQCQFVSTLLGFGPARLSGEVNAVPSLRTLVGSDIRNICSALDRTVASTSPLGVRARVADWLEQVEARPDFDGPHRAALAGRLMDSNGLDAYRRLCRSPMPRGDESEEYFIKRCEWHRTEGRVFGDGLDPAAYGEWSALLSLLSTEAFAASEPHTEQLGEALQIIGARFPDLGLKMAYEVVAGDLALPIGLGRVLAGVRWVSAPDTCADVVSRLALSEDAELRFAAADSYRRMPLDQVGVRDLAQILSFATTAFDDLASYAVQLVHRFAARWPDFAGQVLVAGATRHNQQVGLQAIDTLMGVEYDTQKRIRDVIPFDLSATVIEHVWHVARLRPYYMGQALVWLASRDPDRVLAILERRIRLQEPESDGLLFSDNPAVPTESRDALAAIRRADSSQYLSAVRTAAAWVVSEDERFRRAGVVVLTSIAFRIDDTIADELLVLAAFPENHRHLYRVLLEFKSREINENTRRIAAAMRRCATDAWVISRLDRVFGTGEVSSTLKPARQDEVESADPEI